VNLTLKNVRK